LSIRVLQDWVRALRYYSYRQFAVHYVQHEVQHLGLGSFDYSSALASHHRQLCRFIPLEFISEMKFAAY